MPMIIRSETSPAPILAAVTALLLGSFLPGSLLAAEAERGRALAVAWCSACHVVADDVPGGTLGPAFSTVIAPERRTPAQTTGWPVAPHLPMPDFGLSAREIADLVAYIESVSENRE